MKIKKSICLILIVAVAVFPLLVVNVNAESTENLALGKSYTIEYESPIENGFSKFYHNDSDKKLTNGKKADSNIKASDAAWLRLFRGTAITVTIDLGEIYSVKSIALGQLQINAAGIYSSRYVNAAVSEDGENFATVGSEQDEKTITNTSTIKVDHEIEFEKYYKARYVRVIFSNDVWSYNDEIEVFGSADVNLGSSIEVDEPAQYTDAFQTDIDGVKNIVLMYCGKYYKGQASDIGANTAEQMLPYFAYTDNKMKPIDTMFDGMLFLPLWPIADNSTGTEECSFAKKTGWQAYLDSVIGKGDEESNLAALNKLVGQYRSELELGDDYKYPVYISVPYIDVSNTVVFGEIDGELIIPSTLESRVKIVKWFVDNIISSFNEAGFENLQLNGLYWQEELVRYSTSEYEDDLIKIYNEYVHEKGYTSIWIPYYCAPGFETWKELGFDAAVMQNGYSFIEYENEETGKKLPGVVDDALAQCKKYGLGMEVEASNLLNQGDAEAYNRYYKYLHSAYINGLMENGLCMYYQGGGPGILYHCAKSSNVIARKAYDLTYKYIKKTFTSYVPVVEPDQFIIIKKGSKATGYLEADDKDTAIGLLNAVNVEKPANVSLSVTGSFVSLKAAGDFLGEDSFSLQLSDGFNISEKITVKVYVVEDCAVVKSKNKPLKDNSVYIYDEAGKTTETDEDAYEVVVSGEDKIISIGGNNNSVPDGGFVVAAKGEAKNYLTENAKVGKSVLYDQITNTVIFTGEGESETVDIIWIIIGAFVLVAVGAIVFIIIKNKTKKGAVN